MQPASSRIWTRVADYISYEDNLNAMRTIFVISIPNDMWRVVLGYMVPVTRNDPFDWFKRSQILVQYEWVKLQFSGGDFLKVFTN